MTLKGLPAPALGVEERSDEAPGAGASGPPARPDPEVVAKPKVDDEPNVSTRTVPDDFWCSNSLPRNPWLLMETGILSPVSTSRVVFFSWGWFTWVDWPRTFPPPEVSPVLIAVGLVGIAVGMTGLFAGIAYLGFARSNGLAPDLLQRSGPYRLSRNPQVLACTVAVLGYALLWPSWHTLGWIALYAVMVHTMVLTEEEHLLDLHGEAYARYRARVPRYVGVRRRRLAVDHGGRED